MALKIGRYLLKGRVEGYIVARFTGHRDPPDEEHERSLEKWLGSHEPADKCEDRRRNHLQPLTQSGHELGRKYHRSSGKCCTSEGDGN